VSNNHNFFDAITETTPPPTTTTTTLTGMCVLKKGIHSINPF
jgi:hypothetical protein